ncbi:MAG TPA: SET domain-containing protein-lysine N-methyltransferase [Polyangiaceae bacterium]|nr:SET domain-containing protein-lysine N-methyltransferase [Polyangiaceae bacterium]
MAASFATADDGPSSAAEVRKSALGEHGLVASSDLPAGVAVARFEGPVVAWRDVPDAEARHALWIEDDAWLLPRTPARYVNHSCDANCVVDDDLFVVTTRPVRNAEELTIDYVTVDVNEYRRAPERFFWDERWTFACRCGSPRCLGNIDGYRLIGRASAWGGGDPVLSVGTSAGKGRGVFARRRIVAGERFERAPVLVIPAKEWANAEKTAINDYCFCWGERDEHAALALGLGSLLNHSFEPNAVFVRDLAAACIDFVALRDVLPGEELTVNYNEDPSDRSPLWFEPVL